MIKTLIEAHYTDNDLNNAIVFCKDTNHRYRYINDTLLNIIAQFVNQDGLRAEEFYDATDKEIFPNQMANLFVEYDKAVLSAGKATSKFEIFEFPTKQQAYAASTKKPLYHDGELIGVMGNTRFLNMFNINNKTIFLSMKEMKVLTHILFGLSLKEISTRLNIAISTTATYLERIKLKLNITSKNELINCIQDNRLVADMFNYMNKLNEGKETF